MKCLKCKGSIKNNEENTYGLHTYCFKEWFKVVDITNFDNLNRKNDSSNSEEKGFNKFNSSFFQGKFKKYSASLESTDYILKVEEKNFEELPATEFLCNKIAVNLKIHVAEHFFINFHGLETFVTKNFIDRNKRHILHHIYHYFKEGEQFNVKTIIKIIEKQVGRIGDIEKFVELCLFDSLIGNHDRHGRNLAFLEERGQLHLSPFYDNPSYIGIEDPLLLEAEHSPKGKIATTLTNEPSMSDYVREFMELGFEYIVKDFLRNIRISSIKTLINSSYISRNRQNALIRIIESRYKELQDEL
ncbi:MAG: HipA domain-containing protein [Candidatus Pacebacteria bacterium]|nr:HipA domain-containing protein [Candidatus Paceibacterota bacterium]